jgi:hypothetical protein
MISRRAFLHGVALAGLGSVGGPARADRGPASMEAGCVSVSKR